MKCKVDRAYTRYRTLIGCFTLRALLQGEPETHERQSSELRSFAQSAGCVVLEAKRASLLALVIVRHLVCCVAVQRDVYSVGFAFVTLMRCRCLT